MGNKQITVCDCCGTEIPQIEGFNKGVFLTNAEHWSVLARGYLSDSKGAITSAQIGFDNKLDFCSIQCLVSSVTEFIAVVQTKTQHIKGI